MNSLTLADAANFGTRELTPDQVKLVSIEHNPMVDDERTAYEGIRAMLELAHRTARYRGWYTDLKTGNDKERNFGEVLMLMVSELAECMEANRRMLPDDHLPWRDGTEVEFADTIIRISDTAEALHHDIAAAFIEKNRFNQIREDHSIEQRNKEGGKQY